LEDERPRLEGNGFRAERVFPPLNMWEDEGNLYAECELPGVQMEDLEVTVIGRDLTIKGQRKPHDYEGAPYHRRERDMGSFHRVVHLPIDIDSSKVNAELQHGVLTMTLPKAPEARPRKIEVKCLTSK
jgi:HSP20 family protein